MLISSVQVWVDFRLELSVNAILDLVWKPVLNNGGGSTHASAVLPFPRNTGKSLTAKRFNFQKHVGIGIKRDSKNIK